jgi:lipopolysaccharide/colanic/teichoic acid biosynthesis glycosyltransferase
MNQIKNNILKQEKQEHETAYQVEMSITSTYTPPLSYFLLKRIIDISVSIIAIVLCMPLLLVIALLVKLEDGGTVLHRREIIGFRGQRFFALKFRTMIPNADTYLAQHPELLQEYQKNMKLQNDPRVTRVGKLLRKTSLDELLQLFNILVGQMSLVGPRIIHPSELPRYGSFGEKRLLVKPGLTGLWQISARQHISYDERVALDMQYIDARSLWLDLTILVKTLKVFVVHTGA